MARSAFALRLRAMRQGRGWSLDDLSERAGVARNVLIGIETETEERPHRGRPRTFRKLAEAFGLAGEEFEAFMAAAAVGRWAGVAAPPADASTAVEDGPDEGADGPVEGPVGTEGATVVPPTGLAAEAGSAGERTAEPAAPAARREPTPEAAPEVPTALAVEPVVDPAPVTPPVGWTAAMPAEPARGETPTERLRVQVGGYRPPPAGGRGQPPARRGGAVGGVIAGLLVGAVFGLGAAVAFGVGEADVCAWRFGEGCATRVGVATGTPAGGAAGAVGAGSSVAVVVSPVATPDAAMAWGPGSPPGAVPSAAPSPSPSATARPTPSATPSPAPTATLAPVCSDFNDRSLDAGFWTEPTDPDRIFARDGVLHLRADPALPDPVRPQSADVTAVVPSEGQIERISVVMVVEPPLPGGAALVGGRADLVVQLGGRNYQLQVVDGPDGPVLRRSICPVGRCREPADIRNPAPEPLLETGRRYQVGIRLEDGRLEFTLDGRRLGEPEATAGGEVERWWLSLLADPALGQGVDVTVDDACVTYAGG